MRDIPRFSYIVNRFEIHYRDHQFFQELVVYLNGNE